MTLEELWQFFPIILTPHNPDWKLWARTEMKQLEVLFEKENPLIHHIGSTAIPDINAKPIIDILVEFPLEVNWQDVKRIMEKNGYLCMAETDGRISFNKGYTPEGYAAKVYHIHCNMIGDRDEVIFRDYLISHPAIAREYECLKLSLVPRFKNDRDGYTAAKTNFVKRIVALAKESI